MHVKAILLGVFLSENLTKGAMQLNDLQIHLCMRGSQGYTEHDRIECSVYI